MYDISFLIGHHIQLIDTVDSTNNYVAKEIKSGNLTEGSVIMANFQTKGKGRNSNSWQSERGSNLMFSFFVKPKKLTNRNQFGLQKWITTAVCKWLKELGIAAQIKLPNDIFVGKKKIAGILIENKWQGENIYQSVVGVGVNLNQDKWTGHFNHQATSVKLELGKQQEVTDSIQKLCSHLSYTYAKFMQNTDSIDEIFHQNLIRNCFAVIENSPSQEVELVAVSNDGQCTVRLKNQDKLKIHIDQLKLHL